MLTSVWRVGVLVPLLLVSCAAPVVNLLNEYDSQQMSWARAGGTSSIQGEGFLRSIEGKIQTCAGLEILLIPESRYAAERFNSVYFHNFGVSIRPILISRGIENSMLAKDLSGRELFLIDERGQKHYQTSDGQDTLFSLLDYDHTYKSLGKSVTFSPSITAFFTDIKKAKCDVDGQFQFSNLSAGTYYVEAPIFWSVSAGAYVACPEGNCVAGSLGTALAGTTLMMKIALKSAQSLNIQLSSSYP